MNEFLFINFKGFHNKVNVKRMWGEVILTLVSLEGERFIIKGYDLMDAYFKATKIEKND